MHYLKGKKNPLNSETLQEGNVTLQLDGKTRVNLRIETHPLKQGGEPTRHANVEVTRMNNRGQYKVTKNGNTHITD